MKILECTRLYEKWLAEQMEVFGPDLVFKHRQMKTDEFLFLRATYYRWCQLWERHCGPLKRGPKVLSVGDLHIKNFGTWRDADGRLVWGVNDFDEAALLPWTHDLVRLMTSAAVAVRRVAH